MAGCRRRLGRLWPLLFPAAYSVHLAEEVWGDPGFVHWAAQYLSPGFTESRFIAINFLAWPAMLIASVIAILASSARWLVATLAVIVLVNGMLHVGATVVTGAYSPGVVSGALLYLPLGAFSMRRAARVISPRKLALGVGLGVAVHALVALVAFGVRR